LTNVFLPDAKQLQQRLYNSTKVYRPLYALRYFYAEKVYNKTIISKFVYICMYLYIYVYIYINYVYKFPNRNFE